MLFPYVLFFYFAIKGVAVGTASAKISAIFHMYTNAKSSKPFEKMI
jgi:hypothetical protein